MDFVSDKLADGRSFRSMTSLRESASRLGGGSLDDGNEGSASAGSRESGAR